MGEITKLKKIIFFLALSAAAICRISAGSVIYVDDDGPADFNNIQAAIDAANNGDTVLVADGTYIGAGNRDIDFHGKAITVRSENGPDNCTIDCNATITNLHRGFHFHNNEGSSSVVMGFTITRGYADGGGGGVYCDSSDPKITNCHFVSNMAKSSGGGIYNKGSQPVVTNCTFTNNVTYPSGFGGGMHNYYSSPIVIRCKFEGNGAHLYGGGMGNAVYSSPLVINCAFIGNFGPGAGMFNTNYCNPTILNCAFIGNGTGAGAGMYNNVECNPTLINCTFTGNRSVRDGGGISNEASVTTVYNSIFWGNIDENGYGETSQIYGGTLIIHYSCVQGWTGAFGGFGNIGENPLLVDIDGPDDILGTADDNPHLLPDSPCVNAGNNAAILADTIDIDGDGNTTEPIPFDLDGNPRLINDTVDMGAYEYQNPRILYVDSDAFGQSDGSDWTNAYTNLQDALAVTEGNNEIRVAQGIYTPDSNSADPNGSDDREATFRLINGVTIKGGYAGYGEPNPDARNIEKYKTILSGDLAGNDRDVNDPRQLHNDPYRADNSYHVVNGSGCDESAVLAGFTITGGNANGSNSNHFGGGMYNSDGSPTLTICIFKGNTAEYGGGGTYGDKGNPTLNNCTFIKNSASYGGGILSLNGHPTITNCKISNNTASGIYLLCAGHPTILNCTITGNLGGGIYRIGGMPACGISTPTITNSIVWDNRPQQFLGFDGSAIVTNSNIYGGWSGEGNIDADPFFAKPGYWDPNGTPADANDDFWIDGDYHLKSEAGRWDSNSQSWVKDDVNSPCIDAGDPNSDWRPELWPHGKRINMGAYGGTPEASMSTSDSGNIADLNFDGLLCYRDMKLLTDKWLCETLLLPEDLSRDGIVNFTDYAIFAHSWELPARNPNPPNGAATVNITADLSWTAGRGATSHDVYFGTNNPPPFIRNQPDTTFDPGTMDYITTYYWRIDEVNKWGTTMGPVWCFTTIMFPPSTPPP